MSPYEQWIAFLTIMRKEVRRYLRIWTQTLLPSAITMSLYFLIFGTLIGKRIGTMGGVGYMEFVVPGLIDGHHNEHLRECCGLFLWGSLITARRATGLSNTDVRDRRLRCGRCIEHSCIDYCDVGGAVLYQARYSQLARGARCRHADLDFVLAVRAH